MSLQWQLSRDVPADTAAIGRASLPDESDPYRTIGDRFDELMPAEALFAPIYESGGRGAISPLLLAIITVFQMMEKLPDRTAARMVAVRIDWKYAAHLPLPYPGFHFTDLYAFRQRLLEHGWERKVFDDMLQRLLGLGWLRARGKMRTDSTHLLGQVEWLTRLELVLESIRLALRALTQADAAWVEEHIPQAFRDVHEQPENLYPWSDAKVEAALPKAGQAGFWLVGQLQRDQQTQLLQLPAVGVLRQVLAQQFPQGPDQPPPKDRPSGKTIINSPHDPEARQGVKRSKLWFGYKTQVTESCDADLPHLISDIEVVNALEADGQALAAIQARLAARQLLPEEQQVDYSYISGEHLAASLQQDIRLLGPAPRDTLGPPAFRQADFQFDPAARQATCPAGATSQVWSEPRRGAPGYRTTKIRFAAKTCQACRFFGICTKSPQGRSLELHPFRNLLNAYRNLAQSDAFQRALHLRAGIEATISELTRTYGLRRARYRGTQKLRLQAAFTGIAINLNRLVRWWNRTRTTQAAVG